MPHVSHALRQHPIAQSTSCYLSVTSSHPYTPHPLHEYATRKSWPHFSQRARENPCTRMAHSKYFRRSRSRYAGTELPRNPRLHRAHQRAAATATSPNSAAPLDTSHSPSVRRRCWPHSYCASPSRSTNTPFRLS